MSRRKVILFSLMGCLLLVVLGAGIWMTVGEQFLSPNAPLEGGVLVVEGWIGRVGVEAAAKIALTGNYSRVIAVGARTGNGWGGTENYARLASKCLITAGVPSERVMEVGAPWSSRHRTYASALAVRTALERANLQDQPITLFTLGAHGRRTWIVFRKALGQPPERPLGIISWKRPEDKNRTWWRESARARDFISETVGWLYEALWNSGRPKDWKPS